jgi:hypothetical protein
LKALLDTHADSVEVVGVNDLFDTATNAHLFKYDSNYGVYGREVEAREHAFVVDAARGRGVATAGASHGATLERVGAPSPAAALIEYAQRTHADDSRHFDFAGDAHATGPGHSRPGRPYWHVAQRRLKRAARAATGVVRSLH